MVDIVDAAVRSRMMSAIRGKDTGPERLVRVFLHRHGFRFRLHRKILSTRPDIVLPKYELAIFVHGCFWHRHRGCSRAATPTTHSEKWQSKFEANIDRDKRNMSQLREAGWRVFVLWECALDAELSSPLAWLPMAVRDHRRRFIEWPAPTESVDSGA